ncbi:MAG: Mov34/MPN/PAD-1 family protein [Candidatus Methylomirabilia bacterium]
MIVTPEEYAQIRSQAEAEYPHECCGVILASEGSASRRRLVPCRNVQNELHAKDPERHPRDACAAYFIASEDLLKIGRLEAEGFRIRTVYHSHIDAGAYFSDTDKQNARLGGEPLYPDATYLVVSVAEGRVADAGAFRWDPSVRDFRPVPLDKP